jgi:hypothetical protein
MTTRQLTADDRDAFGRELDTLRLQTLADLGQRDVDHIRRIIRLVRYTEVGGRALLHFGVGPLTFALGVGALGASKILENMEVGHNVMHGQYDWTGDPALDSRAYEWDFACTGDSRPGMHPACWPVQHRPLPAAGDQRRPPAGQQCAAAPSAPTPNCPLHRLSHRGHSAPPKFPCDSVIPTGIEPVACGFAAFRLCPRRESNPRPQI